LHVAPAPQTCEFFSFFIFSIGVFSKRCVVECGQSK
jgi:hypothetical protein